MRLALWCIIALSLLHTFIHCHRSQLCVALRRGRMEASSHGSDVLQDQQLLSMFMDIEPMPAAASHAHHRSHVVPPSPGAACTPRERERERERERARARGTRHIIGKQQDRTAFKPAGINIQTFACFDASQPAILTLQWVDAAPAPCVCCNADPLSGQCVGTENASPLWLAGASSGRPLLPPPASHSPVHQPHGQMHSLGGKHAVAAWSTF